MANDCLVTKLKSVVDNDNLYNLLTLKFKLTVPEGLTNYSKYWLQISDSPGVTIHVTNGKHIYAYDNSTPTVVGTDLGETTITQKYNNYCFADAGEYYVEVSKLALYKVKFPVEAEFDLRELIFTPLFTLNFCCKKTSGTLSNVSTAVEDLTIDAENGNSGNVNINAEQISKITNLKNVTSYWLPISGNVLELGKLKNIVNLYFAGSQLQGNIEDFVKEQVALGNTTKSITWGRLHGSSIKFNNHTFSTGYNTTFSWEPSHTVGKTVITNGSETVEINN